MVLLTHEQCRAGQSAGLKISIGLARGQCGFLRVAYMIHLVTALTLWDNPMMKLVADKNGRICSAELFPPRTAFDASRQPDGSVRVVQLVEKEVPLVKPIRTRDGFLMLPVKVSRESIRAALRADRDAR